MKYWCGKEIIPRPTTTIKALATTVTIKPLPTTVTIKPSPTTIAIKPSTAVAPQEPYFRTLKYYLIEYALPDFYDLLKLLKREFIFENFESTQGKLDDTWSTQSMIVVKIDSFFDQIIMLWKDHEKRNHLDASQSVRTVFEAKYEIEQLIREIGNIAAKAKNTSKKVFSTVNVIKKNTNAKTYLAMSICKSIMDDIIDALAPNYIVSNKGNQYNQFFELITKDL